ncbi:MAG: hypothetical protein LBQ62_03145 [Candidatus Accumulibacter sp.]|jgi:hypothetical protein|nr:hypothetical protein [Accumulibacter sp.]
MDSHFLGFLSGLAYLALCLLIASRRAGKKRLPGGPLPGIVHHGPDEAFTIGQLAEEDGGRPLAALLSLSCLISLLAFLFMPFGTLPSLIPVSGGALFVVGALAAALGFLYLAGGSSAVCRGWGAPVCLGASLAVIAQYARQRGVPGDLSTLDAYVAMPVIGVAEGVGKSGVGILAAISLLALWNASPAGPAPAGEEKPPRAGEALLVALASELWLLAGIAFWVCLFFPFSLASGQDSAISGFGGLALNALLFWGKVLGLEWSMEKARAIPARGLPFPATIFIAFLALGAWLLLGVAAE